MVTNPPDIVNHDGKTVAVDLSTEAFLLGHCALPAPAIAAALFHKLIRLSGQATRVRNDAVFVVLLDALQNLAATNNAPTTHAKLRCWFERFFEWSASEASGAGGVSIYLLPIAVLPDLK